MKKYSAPKADFITMSSMEPIASTCVTAGNFVGSLVGPNPLLYFTLGESVSGCDDRNYSWVPGQSNS